MAWRDRTDAPPRLSGRAGQARRARILARDPICTHCHRRPSTIADHVINLATSGKDDRLVTDDALAGLCKPCHDAKTARESQAGRRALPTRTRPPERHPGDVS